MDRGAKKSAAKDEKQDQKFEAELLKSLEEVATPDDKLKLLLRKHVDAEKVQRRSRLEQKTQEKQLEAVLREKENLQREYNKSVLMRDKLQEVCREQQKLIKSVKNESMQKIREEEERRKESQTKFQASLNDITHSLSKNNDENLKLRDHNIEMTKKLKYLADQYHTREQQLEKLNQQVQLESQLHQAKLNKVQVESSMEKEILIKEKLIIAEKLNNTQKLIKELTQREVALKEQLHLYTAKYDDFQTSLQKSNDVFATYKAELEKMAKNNKKIEKEAYEWRRKWEASNATLIELATEKKDRDDHAIRCNKQVDQLQKLLRALQTERTHLYKVMREQNVECPPMPPLPQEPEPMKTAPIANVGEKDKMEMMSKNCAELKQTLSNLQSQMKYLNLKGAEAEQQAKQLQQQEEAIKKSQNTNSSSSKKKQKSKGKKIAAAAAAAAAAATKESSPADSLSASSNVPQESEEASTSAAVVVAAVSPKEEGGEVEATAAVNATEVVAEKVNTVPGKVEPEEPAQLPQQEEEVEKGEEKLPAEIAAAAPVVVTAPVPATPAVEPVPN